MNLDIVEMEDGFDLGVARTDVPKAANVLSIQLGDLEYAPTFGVDLKFFLTSEFQIQNESFKSYLVERLTNHQINVSGVIETVNALFTKYTVSIGNASISEGLMR